MISTFALHFTTYHGPLYHWMLSETRNREQAEDLVSRAFERAWQYRRTLRDPAKFKPWLFMIAANLLVKRTRAQQIQPVSLDDPETDWGQRLELTENVLEALIQAERGEFFRVTLASLPPHMRQALRLASAGLKYRQIAHQLNVPMGTVKSRLNAARVELKEREQTALEGVLSL